MSVYRSGQRSTKQKHLHTFPILSQSEILLCMSELDMRLTEQDFHSPSADKMRMVYENFVDLLMGISKEDIQQPQFQALDVLEYPALHEDSIPRVTFLKALFKLMRTVGVPDFNMTDINAPESKRTRRNLSALINFAKFREERIGKYTEETVRTEELMDLRHTLEMKHQEQTTRLQQLRIQQRENEPVARQVQRDTQGIHEDIVAANKKQAALQSSIRQLKAQNNEISDKVTSTKHSVHQANLDINRLKSQIVHSPDKVKHLIEEMSASVATEKEMLSKVQEKSMQMQSRLNGLCKIEEDIAKCIELMDQCEREIAKSAELQGEVKEFQNRIQEQENALRDIDSNKQRLDYSVQSMEAKQTRLREDRAAKKKEAQKGLEKMRREKMEADKRRMANSTMVNQNKIAAKQMNTKMQQLRESHEAEMQTLRRQVQTLVDAVRDYHHDLFQATAAAM